MSGKTLVSISASTNSYLLVRLPNDIEANAIIYKNKIFPLNSLNSTYNGLLEYLANIDENLASEQNVDIDVVIYNNKGVQLPHDAILNRNGQNYILTINKNKAISKQVDIVASGEQGVIVENVSLEDKIVVAKQDILLKLLSGVNVRTIK